MEDGTVLPDKNGTLAGDVLYWSHGGEIFWSNTASGVKGSFKPEDSPGGQESDQGTAAESGAVSAGGILVETDWFSVSLPESWRGKTGYQIVPGQENGYSLEFYHAASRDAGMGGFLFAISLYGEGAEPDLPAMRSMGRLIYKPAEVYAVIAEFPTDVQYPMEYEAEYQGLREDFDGIIDSFTVSSYYEFQKSD